jgi:hypothetical protein
MLPLQGLGLPLSSPTLLSHPLLNLLTFNPLLLVPCLYPHFSNQGHLLFLPNSLSLLLRYLGLHLLAFPLFLHLVEGHGGGEDQGVLMASLTTIYRNKNSHSHMIKSHD